MGMDNRQTLVTNNPQTPTQPHNHPQKHMTNRNKIQAQVSDFLAGSNLLWLWLVGVLCAGGWYELRYSMDVFQVVGFLLVLLVTAIVLTNSDR